MLVIARGEKRPEIAETFCESCHSFKVELNRSDLGWHIGGRTPEHSALWIHRAVITDRGLTENTALRPTAHYPSGRDPALPFRLLISGRTGCFKLPPNHQRNRPRLPSLRTRRFSVGSAESAVEKVRTFGSLTDRASTKITGRSCVEGNKPTFP